MGLAQLIRTVVVPMLVPFVLGACSPAVDLPAEPTPTASVTATGSPPTAAPASATFSPLTEATEPIVLEPGVIGPSATPAPAPIHLPDNPISLYDPGPGSQVLSPIRISGFGGPSHNERIRMRLYDEQWQLLDEHVTILFAFPGNAGRFVSRLQFEQSQLAQTGWIQIDSLDRRYGRTAHRFTREVVLLRQGIDRLRPGFTGPAQIAILQPQADTVVQMGTLEVSGGGYSQAGGGMQLQAWDRTGEVVASVPIELSSGDSGEVGTFSVNLTVELFPSQYGRLAVLEADPDSGQAVYINSIEVWFQR